MTTLAQIVDAAIRSWNSGDLEGYLSLYDPAIRLHGYSPEPMDKATVREFYKTVWSSLSDPGATNPRLVVQEVLTDGGLYSCRFAMSGTHRGPFLGVPATNRPYVLPGITIMRFGDDGQRVVERFASADMLGLLVQLGAVPAPA
jgi:hypothetical protein